MADTTRQIADILALFPNNSEGLISPQDLRDFVVSSMPTGRPAAKLVAASDTDDLTKAQADYVCDGTDDQVQVQSAIDALRAYASGWAEGGAVLLSDGNFSFDSPLVITAADGYLALVGQKGRYATTILWPAAATALQIGNGSSKVASMELHDLGFYSAGSPTSGTVAIDLQGGTSDVAIDRLLLNRVRVDRSYVGLQGTGWQWLYLNRCDFTGITHRCLDLEGRYNVEGHFTDVMGYYSLPASAVNNAACVRFSVYNGGDGNPPSHCGFVGSHFNISPGASATGVHLIDIGDGRSSQDYWTMRGLKFDHAMFESLGDETDSVGVYVAGRASIDWSACQWYGNGAMRYGIQTASSREGIYRLGNAYFNSITGGTGYNIYNQSGMFMIDGYHSEGEDNDILTATEVVQRVSPIVKAGVPSDADVPYGALALDGLMALDTTNNRLYVREDGAWKYAALT